MSKKKLKLEFDSRGGVLVVSRAMRETFVYQSMPAPAKVLMDLLQAQWRNEKSIGYGVREAAQKIGCTKNTAAKAFNILQDRGFIVCIEESLFNSRNGSRTRDWLLTWMPFNGKKPTHNWEKWEP
jgi:hypothetical protein